MIRGKKGESGGLDRRGPRLRKGGGWSVRSGTAGTQRRQRKEKEREERLEPRNVGFVRKI